jgi:hypothetical protein
MPKCLFCLIVLVSAPGPVAAQREFPEMLAARPQPAGDREWAASTTVAVGEVVNVASYGEQTVDHLPQPMSASVHKLYWCQGDFRLTAVVKGQAEVPRKKYLWASARPGCALWPDDPSLVFSRYKTRVWFLREEGNFLRPPYDVGGAHFIGLLSRWDESHGLSARRHLGSLLLDPAANSDTLSDYAGYLGVVAAIACELLGQADCTSRLRALAGLGNAPLRDAACGLLNGLYGTGCGQRD